MASRLRTRHKEAKIAYSNLTAKQLARLPASAGLSRSTKDAVLVLSPTAASSLSVMAATTPAIWISRQASGYFPVNEVAAA